MKQIIKYDGTLTQINNDKLSANFSVSELDCEGQILIAQPLIDLLQAFRDSLGKSIKINSGYRTEAKQAQLKQSGYKAAGNSPHLKGMAADIDTGTIQQSNEFEAKLWEVAKKLKIAIRTGNLQYQKAGQTFVHVDVCPFFFSPGKPHHHVAHPLVWEREIKW